MADKPAIEVTGLGKRYTLRHDGGPRYLRDRLAQLVRAPARLLRGSAPTPDREEFWALRDVNFSVRPGEVLGILGRNGAGKSTLLKVLSRITEPTLGRVTVRGRVASLLEVGTGFHPELTGRENIFLNGAILGMTRVEIRGKLDAIVAFSEVERFLDTPVKHYSSGMYVRLAFAVAAHLEPDILIVDEVLAVGDLAFQKKCLGRLDAVSQSGRTVLFVSHNLEALRSICQSGLLLEEGRIKASGPIQEVVGQYQRTHSELEAIFAPVETRPSITKVAVDAHQLHRGELHVEVHYNSPFPLNPALAGIVLANADGRPLFGSNMRMHPVDDAPAARSGVCTLVVPNLPLHSASYMLSATLGDASQQYDSKVEAVSFPYVSPRHYPNRPPLHQIGPLDPACRWTSAAVA